MPNKIVEYAGKKIYVYENVFNRRENLGIYDLIVNAPFTRTNVDVHLLNNRDADVKWWSTITPDSNLSSVINPQYMTAIDAFDWNKVAITGQYINYSSSNSVDNLHADVFDEKNSYTILHYANHTWDVNWHGETMFYSDTCTEVIYSQIIKPGTVVVFDSRIQHSAVPCSCAADNPRFTIATKLFLKT
jgi:hypothetical protein